MFGIIVNMFNANNIENMSLDNQNYSQEQKEGFFIIDNITDILRQFWESKI